MTIKDRGQFVRSDRTLYEPTSYRGEQSDDWGGGDSTTTYQHVSKDQIYPGTFLSDAELKIEHQGASGHTLYPPAVLLNGEATPPDERSIHEKLASRRERMDAGGPMMTDAETMADWQSKSERYNTTDIPGQQSLFHHKSSPATSTVDLMRSTKGGRVANMTQLGMAARDVMLERGHGLTPSTDLSPHSDRLVGKLREKGLVQGHEKQMSNDLTFNRFPINVDDYPTQDREYKPVDPEALAGGRRAIRSILGRNRPVGEQGSLFE